MNEDQLAPQGLHHGGKDPRTPREVGGYPAKLSAFSGQLKSEGATAASNTQIKLLNDLLTLLLKATKEQMPTRSTEAAASTQ
jgi:hypothetical protein